MAEPTSTRPTSPVRARRRTAYLDAAEALVDEGQRYVDMAVADIAERAGFSRASFYAYFTDKRELASAIAERLRTQLVEGVGGWLRGEDTLSLDEALARAVETFEARRGAVLLLAEAAALDADLAALWRSLHAEFEALVQRRLTQLDPPPEPAARAALAYVLIWSTEAVIVEHLRGRRPSRGALVRALTVLWRGVLSP